MRKDHTARCYFASGAAAVADRQRDCSGTVPGRGGLSPALLVDEADTFLAEADELRGVLNSGHRKGGQVVRTVGDDHEPRAFSTFAAVAIAIIGKLPDTLADRSITVDLKRRMPSEAVASFRFDRVAHLDVLARQAARWAQDHAGTIAAADPEMPGIHNREADNWAPLFAIADVAGGGWPERARAAAAASHVAAGDDEASRTELLLGDIRDIFAKREENKVEPVDRIPSADLVAALVATEGRPWAELGRNRKPLTANGLARRLKPLGITPDSVRVDEKRTPKGYYLHQFEEAFARYLGANGASEPQQRNKADEMGTSAGFQSATAEPVVAVGKCEKSNNDGPCCGVADGKGKTDVSRVCAQQDGLFPRVCVHCGEPERPGDPVQECELGGDGLYLLHRHCQDEWLGEGAPEPAPPRRKALPPAGDAWDIPDWLRRAPT